MNLDASLNYMVPMDEKPALFTYCIPIGWSPTERDRRAPASTQITSSR
jgi:hypothetical protein